jgi:hypothetical protein
LAVGFYCSQNSIAKALVCVFCDIVVQPPQVRSKASSCISNNAKFSGGRRAILALLLLSVIRTITLLSITAQLQQPYEVPSIFQSIG